LEILESASTIGSTDRTGNDHFPPLTATETAAKNRSKPKPWKPVPVVPGKAWPP
jgi:hypothetical protein